LLLGPAFASQPIEARQNACNRIAESVKKGRRNVGHGGRSLLFHHPDFYPNARFAIFYPRSSILFWLRLGRLCAFALKIPRLDLAPAMSGATSHHPRVFKGVSPYAPLSRCPFSPGYEFKKPKNHPTIIAACFMACPGLLWFCS
jgi:hypothetical protein